MSNQVELLGTYGGDETHAASAWCSTGGMTAERKARIPQMLKKLAEDGHHTPFEKSMLHFQVTCDTASHIHLLKHRIGVSVNAESARYAELKGDRALVPDDWPENLQNALNLHITESQLLYHEAIKRLEPIVGRKRAKESARFFLPYANQLSLDVSFNFRSFIHFQKLRNSEHAQLEIREITQKMLELVRASGSFRYSLEGFGYGTTTETR